MQSRNRTRNRVLAMDSLGIEIGTEFLDWTVSEPESESKKLEPGTSGLVIKSILICWLTTYVSRISATKAHFYKHTIDVCVTGSGVLCLESHTWTWLCLWRAPCELKKPFQVSKTETKSWWIVRKRTIASPIPRGHWFALHVNQCFVHKVQVEENWDKDSTFTKLT